MIKHDNEEMPLWLKGATIAMKIATRLNSFLKEPEASVEQVLPKLSELGITAVDLNFPEHEEGIAADEMSLLLRRSGLSANGVALRFRGSFFSNGEFGNIDSTVTERSLSIARAACDYCRAIGGKVVTVWLAFDGFDYSFQVSYAKAWASVVKHLQAICDYAPDLEISVEYKPYEERSYALIDSFGSVYSLIQEVGRPNIGATLDFCHMLMKHDNPAMAADILGSKGRLYGIHLNDGYGRKDDGLMVATSNLTKTLELLYYMQKHSYSNAVYFDTFPIREDALEEAKRNVKMLRRLEQIIDQLGMDWLDKEISKNSGLSASDITYRALSAEGC